MLFAVHLSDGVVTLPWMAVGWVVAAGIVALAAWGVRDQEIPRIGVLTAAFFVASQVHIPIGLASVHLLLNGLVGVILGKRVGLVIAVGLTLQTFLFGHGGKTTLGVNIAVYGVPALVGGQICGPLRRSRLMRVQSLRFLLVFCTAAFWLCLVTVSAQRILAKLALDTVSRPESYADWWVGQPWIGGALAAIALLAAALERRLEADPEFAVGLLLGAGTTLATVGLNAGVLAFGGTDAVSGLAEVVLLANLPVVIVESVAVGFVTAYLAKAKPEWIGGVIQAPGSGKISSNGTSH